MFNILVIEDELNIRKLMAEYLKKGGYNVLEANNGKEALNTIEVTMPDLIITDIMMPEMDGVEFTADMRNAGFGVPILMITAKETLDDKRLGFITGADDYMVKPIEMEEMLIRVSALLRRAEIVNEKKLRIGNCLLDYDSLTLICRNESIELPQKEFQVLYMLLSYPKKIFTRTQLMEAIWGIDTESEERTVDVHIKRLREKISNIKDFEIITIRGLGYKAEKR